MAIGQIEEKYINRTLADLLERALRAKKQAAKMTSSARDRAIWKALAIDSARAYNRAVKNLGLVGTSKLSIEQKELIDDLLFSSSAASILEEEEMDLVIEQSYGLSALERKYERERERKQILELLPKHRELVENLQTLQTLEPVNRRLNSAKGGFVKAAKAQGMNEAQAKEFAEQQVEEKQVEEAKENLLLDSTVKSAVSMVFGSRSTKDADAGKHMLNILSDEPDFSEFDTLSEKE